MTLLAIIWFGLAALLLAIYAMLDGFDLGVGMLYGFLPRGEARRKVLSTISPVWNGNEVFILAGVGSILAAFPLAYGALLSGMYIPVILTLVGLIFRAVGIELRTKTPDGRLGGLLDLMVCVGSLIPAWAIGVVAGNVLAGFPIDQSGYPVADFLGYLNPFALLGGFVSIAVFLLHGLAWLNLKLPAGQGAALKPVFLPVWAVAAVLLAGMAVWAAFGVNRAGGTAQAIPGLIVVAAGCVGSLLAFRAGRSGWSFISSLALIAGTVAAAAGSLFPVVLPSKLDPANSITIASSAVTDSSLLVMLVIALIGVPLIAVYVFTLYRTFRNRS
jgi:cytochrome d ubiquinol oxidase subunit II